MWRIDFHKLSILMHSHRNFEFSARSAKMKRSMSFSDMFVCCAAFYAFTLICDCIFLRSCYIVLLSCFLSFVVLPVSFYSDFTFLPVLCLIRAPSQSSPVPSRFCVAPSGFNLSCLVLLLSISAASSRCIFILFSPSRFAVNPFFFHAALLYESPRRKPG